MPVEETLVDVRVEWNDLKRLQVIVAFEQQQFDTGGILREQGKIYSVRRYRGAKRIWLARRNAEVSNHEGANSQRKH